MGFRSLGVIEDLGLRMWIRLDKGVTSVDWILSFPSSRIHHLDAFHMDHKPILLCLDPEINHFYRKGRPFRFEAIWLKDESCEEVVRKSWGNNQVASSTKGFNKKIISCQENLKLWNRDTFGHVQNSLKGSCWN